MATVPRYPPGVGDIISACGTSGTLRYCYHSGAPEPACRGCRAWVDAGIPLEVRVEFDMTDEFFNRDSIGEGSIRSISPLSTMSSLTSDTSSQSESAIADKLFMCSMWSKQIAYRIKQFGRIHDAMQEELRMYWNCFEIRWLKIRPWQPLRKALIGLIIDLQHLQGDLNGGSLTPESLDQLSGTLEPRLKEVKKLGARIVRIWLWRRPQMREGAPLEGRRRSRQKEVMKETEDLIKHLTGHIKITKGLVPNVKPHHS